ncbi:MAG TPA: flagellar basal body-associated FliL family protein [Steroidobacteraceae bacterium]|nr:flagellar basal body-associated FliL family protein [Steroidobacteraceae bacterium]
MADATTAAAPTKTGSAKRRGKLALLLALGFLAVAAAGASVWWWTLPAAPKPLAVKAPMPPNYLALDPPFVVNFEGEQTVRFLQITVQLMSRNPQTIELLKSNDPVVRDQLLLLFGSQKYSQLATREGKESLRRQALESVRSVINSAGGHPESVEAVYFTSFVMQ